PDVSPSMATRTGAETTNARLSPNRNLVSTLPSFLYVTSLIFITQPPPSPLRSPAASSGASRPATGDDPPPATRAETHVMIVGVTVLKLPPKTTIVRLALPRI